MVVSASGTMPLQVGAERDYATAGRYRLLREGTTLPLGFTEIEDYATAGRCSQRVRLSGAAGIQRQRERQRQRRGRGGLHLHCSCMYRGSRGLWYCRRAVPEYGSGCGLGLSSMSVIMFTGF